MNKISQKWSNGILLMELIRNICQIQRFIFFIYFIYWFQCLIIFYSLCTLIPKIIIDYKYFNFFLFLFHRYFLKIELISYINVNNNYYKNLNREIVTNIYRFQKMKFSKEAWFSHDFVSVRWNNISIEVIGESKLYDWYFQSCLFKHYWIFNIFVKLNNLRFIKM